MESATLHHSGFCSLGSDSACSRSNPAIGDQANRAVRTRMLRGVEGGSYEAPPYPDRLFFILLKT